MSATIKKESFPPLQKTATKGVYKRGGSYVIRYRDPSGKQKKHYVKMYAAARRVRSELAADVSRGEYRATTRITFAQYASGSSRIRGARDAGSGRARSPSTGQTLD